MKVSNTDQHNRHHRHHEEKGNLNESSSSSSSSSTVTTPSTTGLGDKSKMVSVGPPTSTSPTSINYDIFSRFSCVFIPLEEDEDHSSSTPSFTNTSGSSTTDLSMNNSKPNKTTSSSLSAKLSTSNNSSSTRSSLKVTSSTKSCKHRVRSSSLPRIIPSSSHHSSYSSSCSPTTHSIPFISSWTSPTSLDGRNFLLTTTLTTPSSYASATMVNRPSKESSYGHGLCRTKSFRVEKSNNYRIFRATDLVQGRLLGRGFFGEVFLVTHKETGEKMVLKELYRVDEEAQLNFLREAAFLRSLNHPNVLKFIGVLYKDKKLHILTEFISGGTLRELISDINHPLSWERRVNIAKDISSGMHYLHCMQIIHRDLNSQNCLVKDNGTVVVADFGLARMMVSSNRRMSNGSVTGSNNGSGNGGNTSSGGGGSSGKKKDRRKRYTVVGNPYWMAPEMMKGKEYDEKVDVFSFGIILCELIGRIQADPDYMPRNPDFGLNKSVFYQKYCGLCPEPFWKIAFLCTEIDPDRRPSFRLLEKWLQSMSTHWRISGSLNIPNELLNEISSFTGSHRKILEESD